eukprot:1272269-Amphidinium_carterae.1
MDKLNIVFADGSCHNGLFGVLRKDERLRTVLSMGHKRGGHKRGRQNPKNKTRQKVGSQKLLQLHRGWGLSERKVGDRSTVRLLLVHSEMIADFHLKFGGRIRTNCRRQKDLMCMVTWDAGSCSFLSDGWILPRTQLQVAHRESEHRSVKSTRTPRT